MEGVTVWVVITPDSGGVLREVGRFDDEDEARTFALLGAVLTGAIVGVGEVEEDPDAELAAMIGGIGDE